MLGWTIQNDFKPSGKEVVQPMQDESLGTRSNDENFIGKQLDDNLSVWGVELCRVRTAGSYLPNREV
jgi:hypothetical protein